MKKLSRTEANRPASGGLNQDKKNNGASRKARSARELRENSIPAEDPASYNRMAAFCKTAARLAGFPFEDQSERVELLIGCLLLIEKSGSSQMQLAVGHTLRGFASELESTPNYCSDDEIYCVTQVARLAQRLPHGEANRLLKGFGESLRSDHDAKAAILKTATTTGKNRQRRLETLALESLPAD